MNTFLKLNLFTNDCENRLLIVRLCNKFIIRNFVEENLYIIENGFISFAIPTIALKKGFTKKHSHYIRKMYFLKETFLKKRFCRLAFLRRYKNSILPKKVLNNHNTSFQEQLASAKKQLTFLKKNRFQKPAAFLRMLHNLKLHDSLPVFEEYNWKSRKQFRLETCKAEKYLRFNKLSSICRLRSIKKKVKKKIKKLGTTKNLNKKKTRIRNARKKKELLKNWAIKKLGAINQVLRVRLSVVHPKNKRKLKKKRILLAKDTRRNFSRKFLRIVEDLNRILDRSSVLKAAVWLLPILGPFCRDTNCSKSVGRIALKNFCKILKISKVSSRDLLNSLNKPRKFLLKLFYIVQNFDPFSKRFSQTTRISYLSDPLQRVNSLLELSETKFKNHFKQKNNFKFLVKKPIRNNKLNSTEIGFKYNRKVHNSIVVQKIFYNFYKDIKYSLAIVDKSLYNRLEIYEKEYFSSINSTRNKEYEKNKKLKKLSDCQIYPKLKQSKKSLYVLEKKFKKLFKRTNNLKKWKKRVSANRSTIFTKRQSRKNYKKLLKLKYFIKKLQIFNKKKELLKNEIQTLINLQNSPDLEFIQPIFPLNKFSYSFNKRSKRTSKSRLNKKLSFRSDRMLKKNSKFQEALKRKLKLKKLVTSKYRFCFNSSGRFKISKRRKMFLKGILKEHFQTSFIDDSFSFFSTRRLIKKATHRIKRFGLDIQKYTNGYRSGYIFDYSRGCIFTSNIKNTKADRFKKRYLKKQEKGSFKSISLKNEYRVLRFLRTLRKRRFVTLNIRSKRKWFLRQNLKKGLKQKRYLFKDYKFSLFRAFLIRKIRPRKPWRSKEKDYAKYKENLRQDLFGEFNEILNSDTFLLTTKARNNGLKVYSGFNITGNSNLVKLRKFSNKNFYKIYLFFKKKKLINYIKHHLFLIKLLLKLKKNQIPFSGYCKFLVKGGWTCRSSIFTLHAFLSKSQLVYPLKNLINKDCFFKLTKHLGVSSGSSIRNIFFLYCYKKKININPFFKYLDSSKFRTLFPLYIGTFEKRIRMYKKKDAFEFYRLRRKKKFLRRKFQRLKHKKRFIFKKKRIYRKIYSIVFVSRFKKTSFTKDVFEFKNNPLVRRKVFNMYKFFFKKKKLSKK